MARKIKSKKKRKSSKKTIVKSKKSPAHVHPWRICPAGQHYRRATTVTPHIIEGSPVKGGPRSWTCANNPTGKDQLYPEEIQEIAEKNFDQFKLSSLGIISEFSDSNQYDPLIQGWTKYWNDVLQPNEPLDPKLVKALIASESSFDPNAWNKLKGRDRARGLMQVTDYSVQLMKDNFPEFSDHFLNLTEDDMLDPNLAICARIRWLHRKKQLVSSTLKRQATWFETVAAYKSYFREYLKDPAHEQMRRIIEMYEELKNGK